MSASGSVFRSFFHGGFECSTQRRRDGRRLDLLRATRHDVLARSDYQRVKEHGLLTVRDGLRWHRVETSPGVYDWSTFVPMVEAAREVGVQVVWDLCHYGWPDKLDIWAPAFVDRFGAFATAAARVLREETDDIPFWCPVNEISFWAWAAGDEGMFEPVARARAPELKRQLVRAALAATDAVRAVDPRARILHSDPMVAVLPGSERPADVAAAASYHEAQHEARDMLAGRRDADLGGRPDILDLVGVNYYSNNQWRYGGPTVELGHPSYRPMRDLLVETWQRFQRPLVISETGAEASARAAWLFYVCEETRAAMELGVPIEGICLYPVLDYPGWENERPCDAGLFGPPSADGQRCLHRPLAVELARQRALFETFELAKKEP